MQIEGTNSLKYVTVNEDGSISSPMLNVEDVVSYTPYKSDDVTGLVHTGTSLLLEGNTTIKHYFELSDGENIENYTFEIGKERLYPVKHGNKYYVSIENILSKDLGISVKLIIKKGDETSIIKYSPMSYVKTIVENKESYDSKLVELVCSLYKYYNDSSVYFKKQDLNDMEFGADELIPEIW